MKAGKKVLLVVLLIALGLVYFALYTARGTPAPLISDAIAAPLADGGFAVTLKIDNRGGPERLLRASSPEAEAVSIEGAERDSVAIPAGSTPSLSLDGVWLRVAGLSGTPEAGRLVPLTLVFAGAGEIAAKARIVTEEASAAHGEGALEEGPPGAPPGLDMTLAPSEDGWEVRITPVNVSLSPDLADAPHRPGTGHAHLYLDGLKLQRLYGPTARIGALPQGQHTVKVTLNTNDHRTYAVNGEPVTALALIDQR